MKSDILTMLRAWIIKFVVSNTKFANSIRLQNVHIMFPFHLAEYEIEDFNVEYLSQNYLYSGLTFYLTKWLKHINEFQIQFTFWIQQGAEYP